jgi:hypothetical protein
VIRSLYPIGRYLHYTLQQIQEANFHTLCGIRTRDRSNRAAANLPFRPQGQQDRPIKINYVKFDQASGLKVSRPLQFSQKSVTDTS